MVNNEPIYIVQSVDSGRLESAAAITFLKNNVPQCFTAPREVSLSVEFYTLVSRSYEQIFDNLGKQHSLELLKILLSMTANLREDAYTRICTFIIKNGSREFVDRSAEEPQCRVSPCEYYGNFVNRILKGPEGLIHCRVSTLADWAKFYAAYYYYASFLPTHVSKEKKLENLQEVKRLLNDTSKDMNGFFTAEGKLRVVIENLRGLMYHSLALLSEEVDQKTANFVHAILCFYYLYNTKGIAEAYKADAGMNFLQILLSHCVYLKKYHIKDKVISGEFSKLSGRRAADEAIPDLKSFWSKTSQWWDQSSLSSFHTDLIQLTRNCLKETRGKVIAFCGLGAATITGLALATGVVGWFWGATLLAATATMTVGTEVYANKEILFDDVIHHFCTARRRIATSRIHNLKFARMRDLAFVA